METHRFRIESSLEGTVDDTGVLRGADGDRAFGLPVQLGGRPGFANPEELLMQAVASCYSLTLAHLAERRRVPFRRVDLAVDGEVVRQPGGALKFLSMRLQPRIILKDGDASSMEAALEIARKAEQYCVVSNAIRASVELSVQPEVVME